MDDTIHTHPEPGCGSADRAVDMIVPAWDNFSATIFLFQCRISAAWYSDFRQIKILLFLKNVFYNKISVT